VFACQDSQVHDVNLVRHALQTLVKTEANVFLPGSVTDVNVHHQFRVITVK